MVFTLPAGAHELRLTSAEGIEPESILILESDAEVQGLVAAFDWDARLFVGVDLVRGPSVERADLVVRRVEPGYMVLGVVMDTDGRDQEILAPGISTVARARFRCIAPPLGSAVSTDLVFRDGRYGSADLGPILDNLITIGGQTISEREGLSLKPGKLTCALLEPGRLRIRDTVAPPGSLCAPVDILLDTPSPVQGFVLAVAHDPGALSLTGVTITGTVTEASGADFARATVLPGGGTLEVVLDLEAPFLGNTIPIGTAQVIARYSYCCLRDPPVGGPDTVSALRFVDGVLGNPPLQNQLLVGGQVLKPAALIEGTFTCRAGPVRPGQEFRCGPEVASAAGDLPPVVGFAGSTVRACFFYRSPPKDTPGDTGEDQIQGLSMAVCFDPARVECREGTFDIGGTILEAVGAEFVSHHCENSTGDGDPGELVIGILLDASPPFDGHTLPPTLDLLRIGCIDFSISANAPCGSCNALEFCDGADGRGKQPIRNLASVNNFSVRPALFNCEICVAPTPVFQRGDCNFSLGREMAVDLADPVAVISFLFLTGEAKVTPTCLDACDANDDGRVDLADGVFVLGYLFSSGERPPAPGPDQPGPDPTQDPLDCKAGAVCP